ncbi:MAG: hypothetical protein MJZ34_02695 [Paludibacteraceae bacterium]|nr:hypothetical protein [Paludibacteraceae bacterium]
MIETFNHKTFDVLQRAYISHNVVPAIAVDSTSDNEYFESAKEKGLQFNVYKMFSRHLPEPVYAIHVQHENYVLRFFTIFESDLPTRNDLFHFMKIIEKLYHDVGSYYEEFLDLNLKRIAVTELHETVLKDIIPESWHPLTSYNDKGITYKFMLMVNDKVIKTKPVFIPYNTEISSVVKIISEEVSRITKKLETL